MRKLMFGSLSLLVCAALVLTACGQNRGAAVPQAVKAVDQGEIVQKEGNRWLITTYVAKGDTPYIDAYWLTVNERTELRNSGGEAIRADTIPLGAQVEVWHTGNVNESYPAQAEAAKLVLRDDENGRAKAVQTALEAQSSTDVLAVKSAELHQDQGYWAVELVRQGAMEDPIIVLSDAATGSVVTPVVAENEAFRVFTPASGTKVGKTFTVEGEARVFEGTFNWQLEDGHFILAEDFETADAGGPEWGHFKFDVSFEKASQPNMSLILFVYSAKDGNVEHQLVIPLKVPDELIDYNHGQ